MVTTAKTFRTDVTLQEAVLAPSPPSNVAAVNTHTLVDAGKFVGTITTLQGALAKRNTA
ncbi:MAG: hypothetical protein ACLPYY_07805 [Acidimicrobiales bacterium]